MASIPSYLPFYLGGYLWAAGGYLRATLTSSSGNLSGLTAGSVTITLETKYLG